MDKDISTKMNKDISKSIPRYFHEYTNIFPGVNKLFPQVYKDISATIDMDISTTIEKGIFRTKGFTKGQNNELLINKYMPIN